MHWTIPISLRFIVVGVTRLSASDYPVSTGQVGESGECRRVAAG